MTFRTHRLATLAAGILTLAGGLHVHLDRMDTQQIQDYTFDEFVRDFSRSYKRGTPEWASREATFKRNIQKVIEQRARATSWTAGVTKFADYHEDEYNMLLGYKGRRQRGRRGAPPSNMSALGVVDLPPSYDSLKDKPYAGRVMDQGMCGSCWAAAAIATLEGVVEAQDPDIFDQMAAFSPERSHVVGAITDVLGGGFISDALAGLKLLLRPTSSTKSRRRSRAASSGLSLQETVACSENPRNCGGSGGCMGATAELAYDMIREEGVVADVAWPYTTGWLGFTGSCKLGRAMAPKQTPRVFIQQYTVLESNKLLPLKEALYTKGHPVAIGVDATHWNSYRHGIYSDRGVGHAGDFTINHAVTLMGYHSAPDAGRAQTGESVFGYWRIKNSWGTNWGEDGYIRIELKENEQEHCGWDYDTHIGMACDGDPDKAWVCGTCGILYDSTYPEKITLGRPKRPVGGPEMVHGTITKSGDGDTTLGDVGGAATPTLEDKYGLEGVDGAATPTLEDKYGLEGVDGTDTPTLEDKDGLEGEDGAGDEE